MKYTLKRDKVICTVDLLTTAKRLILCLELSQNINDKILDAIRNMYSAAKSFNNLSDDIFECNIGVRQKYNLSPLPLALYLRMIYRSFCLKHMMVLKLSVKL